MKKLLSLLGALLAFSTLFSCSSDESETPAWKELSFTFAVAEPTSNSVEFSIMPDDQSLTYFAYYIKKASYVDDATLKADDRALVEQQAASKGLPSRRRSASGWSAARRRAVSRSSTPIPTTSSTPTGWMRRGVPTERLPAASSARSRLPKSWSGSPSRPRRSSIRA